MNNYQESTKTHEYSFESAISIFFIANLMETPSELTSATENRNSGILGTSLFFSFKLSDEKNRGLELEFSFNVSDDAVPVLNFFFGGDFSNASFRAVPASIASSGWDLKLEKIFLGDFDELYISKNDYLINKCF